MRINLKNNAAKFYPDPFWNDGACLGFFEDGRSNKNKKKKKNNNKTNRMSSDMRSVPDPIIVEDFSPTQTDFWLT